MLAEFWVKLEAKKSRYSRGKIPEFTLGTIEARKSKPDTRANEVAVKITIEIPDAYFVTPEFHAKVKVSESDVARPIITPEVEHNLAQLMSEQLGVTVHLSATEEEEE